MLTSADQPSTAGGDDTGVDNGGSGTHAARAKVPEFGASYAIGDAPAAASYLIGG